MKFKGKTVTYYDYFKDIRPAICRHLGIEEKHFRNYHKVVYPNWEELYGYHKQLISRPYYDFWHVWLELYGEKLHNDSFVKTNFGMPDEEPSEYLVNQLKEKYGDWSLKLLDAVKALQIEQGWDGEKDIVIWYSW